MTLRIGTYRCLSVVFLACSAMACGTEQIIGKGDLETGGYVGIGGGTGSGDTLATGGASHIQQATGGAVTTGGSVNAAGGTTPVTSTTTSSCYAPSANISRTIYSDPNAKGCACDHATQPDVCVNGVALVCENGYWQAVIDGPCGNLPPTFYSPSSCMAAGGTPIASAGGVITPEKDCPSGVALGEITAALSGWVEGGLCCAPTTNTKACGGFAGNTCSETEYCAYEAGGDCGMADGQSVCKPRPNACDAIYTPVCACDQKTYGNACMAALAGLGVLYAGECQ